MSDGTQGAVDGGATSIDPGVIADQIAATEGADEARGGQDESAEDKARRQGWRPQDEFKGPADKWVDAETFLRRGEEISPYIRAENKKLEKALEAQRAKSADLEAQLKKLGEFASKATVNAYNNAKRDIEADLAAATAAGDVEGVKAAAAALVDLGKEVKADVIEAGPDAEWEAAQAEWKAANPWFDGQKPGQLAMTRFAQSVDVELSQTRPNMSPAARLAEVARQVRAEFPEKFTNPNRELPGAVEGAPAQRRSNGRDYSNLPPEAKAMCDKWVKQGVIKDRETYVKGYQW